MATAALAFHERYQNPLLAASTAFTAACFILAGYILSLDSPAVARPSSRPAVAREYAPVVAHTAHIADSPVPVVAVPDDPPIADDPAPSLDLAKVVERATPAPPAAKSLGRADLLRQQRAELSTKYDAQHRTRVAVGSPNDTAIMGWEKAEIKRIDAELANGD